MLWICIQSSVLERTIEPKKSRMIPDYEQIGSHFITVISLIPLNDKHPEAKKAQLLIRESFLSVRFRVAEQGSFGTCPLKHSPRK